MFRLIAMQNGYAESHTAAWLCFGPNVAGKGFASAKDAVCELALDLYAKAVVTLPSERRCTHKVPEGAEFCPKCGASAAGPKPLDAEAFIEYVGELWGSTCDSYSDDERIDHDGVERSLIWNPWKAELREPRQTIEIRLMAAEVVALALTEVHTDFATHNKEWLEESKGRRSTAGEEWARVKRLKAAKAQR